MWETFLIPKFFPSFQWPLHSHQPHLRVVPPPRAYYPWDTVVLRSPKCLIQAEIMLSEYFSVRAFPPLPDLLISEGK